MGEMGFIKFKVINGLTLKGNPISPSFSKRDVKEPIYSYLITIFSLI